MNMLADTIRVASKDLKVFSIAFFLYFFAFTMCGYLLFGQLLVHYNSFVSSAESMFAFALGDFDFVGMQNAQRALGPLFFFTFVFVIYVGMMSIFLTIVADAFTQVKDDVTKRTNKYEIVDFIMKKLKGIMGLDH